MIENNYGAIRNEDATLAAQFVRTLFERHQVPRHKQSTILADILQLSYSQASRRLTTHAAWALEDLRTLAERYGETLADLVSTGQDDEATPATLVLGGIRVPCRLLRGPAVHKPRPGALIATRSADGWLVLAAGHDIDIQAFDVRRVVIEPMSALSRRIAVLDDHTESARSIVDYLAAAGFEATPFTDLEQLAAASAAGRFDGYVLDWLVGRDAARDTARDLVAAIRARDAHCPIVVLTGQMRSGAVDESDIATALVKFRLRFFEKPAPLPLILASLAASFAPE